MWIDNGYQLFNTYKYRMIVVRGGCVLGVIDRDDFDLIESYNTKKEAENAYEEIFNHLKFGHSVMRMPE